MKRLTAFLTCALVILVTSFAKAAETPGDIEWAAKHAVTGACSTPATQVDSDAFCILYTVPAGKRLVVEMVGYYVTTTTGAIWGPAAFGSTTNASYPFSSFRQTRLASRLYKR